MGAGLTGKVALVTGASSGIGAATALALGQAGAAVAVCARRMDRLEALVARIEDAGGRALALPADVTREADAAAAVDAAAAWGGRLDILINSAGVMQTGGIEDCDTEQYRRVFDINLFATLYACRAAIPHLLAAGSGDIVNISSLAARKGGPQVSAYAASKHAVNAMTDALRQELGARGVRVAILMPGATATEVGDNITDPTWRAAIQAHVGKADAVDPADIGATIAFMLALPRRVTISEISVRPTSDVSA